MRVVTAFYQVIDTLTNVVIYIALGAMVINVAVGVFFRYVLSDAIPWSEEASRYMMIWMGFFGMSMATRDRLHVSVMFAVDALPARLRVFVRYLADAIVFAFLLILAVLSIRQIGVSKGQTTPALLLPMAVPYASVTAGAILMILQAIRRTANTILHDLGRAEV